MPRLGLLAAHGQHRPLTPGEPHASLTVINRSSRDNQAVALGRQPAVDDLVCRAGATVPRKRMADKLHRNLIPKWFWVKSHMGGSPSPLQETLRAESYREGSRRDARVTAGDKPRWALAKGFDAAWWRSFSSGGRIRGAPVRQARFEVTVERDQPASIS